MTTIGAPSAAITSDPDRDFWHRALLAGGFAPLPRWTGVPAVGVADHETRIPDDLVAALGQVAAELGVPLSAVLLAAHAKVLAALSGERHVATGYVAVDPGQPLLCRLTTEPASWRSVVLEAQRAESELLARKDFPVTELRRELGLTEPAFETVFDPAAINGVELAEEVVLRVGIVHDRGLRLRLRYRTDALNEESADRIAGYHVTALARIAADPEAEHRQQSLLAHEELRFQLDGLAGRHRELPDRRVHELFEERVEAHPDAVAAVCRDQQWTYRELNTRANWIARALLARGVQREDVVAVVTERNLDWMAAMLAIFKAGGTYLPIEPHFPPSRIATMLSRGQCRLVVTDGSTRTLKQALDSLSEVKAILIDAAYQEEHTDSDLGMAVAPDQLAYVLFTSGSTGEPKGAMCEHAGMLNHMFAKIDDLEIGEGQVVAQTGPQCFDISLWQLLAAILVGGQTLVVEQEAIMDAGRFLDTIVDGRVNVLQVVPSYLDVLLTYLEQRPRELPDLRYVSVTGEAVKMELTQRWFAAQPGIRLMNAYGLTETSDDTNHDVMDGAPDGDRVPLGRPVNNVHAYVVDEYLYPVPLGARGELVFSGVCVGRGYINDPERTRRAFTADPHREGERLYRSGDFGRWRPDGKLEFLGRRDTQVKIRGFRIEIGEVENALFRVPGVHSGAVVISERAEGKRLVAFYSAPQPVGGTTLQNSLAESLPEYMVPSAFHWRVSLPLNPNGKVDRKALTTLAAELDVAEPDNDRPETATEDKLVDAWAKVLGIPQHQIGRHDHFFDLGGTSLSAVKLAIALDRAISVKDLTRHPVLADLAAVIDGKSERQFQLLQPLSNPHGAPVGALVCFPYAGGNAVNFQSMARALRGSGLAVYAVELPGHDLAAQDEPLAPIERVVHTVVDEISRLAPTMVFLWGQSAGAPFALAAARKLHKRAVKVERVFIGAQLLGDAGDRRATVTDLSRRSDAEIADALSAEGGYTELGELDGQRALHAGAAYRHDCLSANRYLAYAQLSPASARLSVPVTVVVAADDPHTEGFAERYREWQCVAEHVDLHELADGGHYFLHTRPAEAAAAVLASVEELTSLSAGRN